MCDIIQVPVYKDSNYSFFFNTKQHNYIIKFLKTHSKNNIVSITGVKKQLMVRDKIKLNYGDFVNSSVELDTKLIIECRCRDYVNFPTMNVLGDMLFSTFRPFFNEFSEIQLEYHYSMYSCRD